MASKLLAVDLGNSELKAACWDIDKGWQPVYRLVWSLQPIEAWARLEDYAQTVIPQHIVVCSVVPSQNLPLQHALTGIAPVQWLHPAKNPVIDLNGYDPHQLGADRWVKLVAARRQWPNQAVILLGMGTCTTVDVLTAEGVFAGGAILPGLQGFLACLHQQTDRLPSLALPTVPIMRPGHTTADCMAAGVSLGYPAMLRHMVRQWQSQLVPGARVVITGGLAEALMRLCAADTGWMTDHDPLLLMNGARYLADTSL